MQILRSVELQESPGTKGQDRCILHAQQQDSPVRIEVHPHNWGDNNTIGFAADDAADESEGEHDLVIVSDCIYNPEFHDDLLLSLSRTLALPTMANTTTISTNTTKSASNGGGVAVVSFSLHGNVQDAAIWEFLDQKLPSTMRNNNDNDNNNDTIEGEVVVWRLHARCVSIGPQPQPHTESQTQITQNPSTREELPGEQHVAREGWDMESTMTDLGMVTEGMLSERWLAYVYEITWVEA
jgi:hypothetical protein